MINKITSSLRNMFDKLDELKGTKLYIEEEEGVSQSIYKIETNADFSFSIHCEEKDN